MRKTAAIFVLLAACVGEIEPGPLDGEIEASVITAPLVTSGYWVCHDTEVHLIGIQADSGLTFLNPAPPIYAVADVLVTVQMSLAQTSTSARISLTPTGSYSPNVLQNQIVWNGPPQNQDYFTIGTQDLIRAVHATPVPYLGKWKVGPSKLTDGSNVVQFYYSDPDSLLDNYFFNLPCQKIS